jgi:uncharacterized protein
VEYALITGATSGIGLELAKIMASRGHDLILVARQESVLKELQAELNGRYAVKISYLAMDLSQAGAARRLYQQCKDKGWSVSHLINNAGYGDYSKVNASKLDTYANLLQLNVVSLTELTCLFVDDMKQRGAGKILNIGSLAAFQPCPNFAVYGASKSYVMNFTEALHHELRGTGVTATVLNPGLTQTGFVARAHMEGAAIAQRGLMPASDVAKIGYDAMMKGKLNVVPGWKNKLLSLGSRTMPSREILLRISALVNRDTSK